jgi:heptosyltransferase-1
MAIVTQRILIVKTSSVGDIMHGQQVAQTLKENDPGIEISWVVRRRFEALVKASSAVDHTFVFYRSEGISAFIRLCRTLRRQRFDKILDFEGLARSGLMTFFAKSDQKVGRSDAREGATMFYRQLVPLPRLPERRHPVDILLEFCRAFGFETELRGRVRFLLKESDRVVEAASVLKPVRIVLAPEGRRERVEWDGFEELAEGLLERLDSAVVYVVCHKSNTWVDSLKLQWGDRVHRFGTSNLLRMAGCIQEADILVGNDSDALQIGAGVGVEVIGLFGPSDPARVGPYPAWRESNCVLQASDRDFKRLKVADVLEEIEKRV